LKKISVTADIKPEGAVLTSIIVALFLFAIIGFVLVYTGNDRDWA
jgi:hypothetical protein